MSSDPQSKSGKTKLKVRGVDSSSADAKNPYTESKSDPSSKAASPNGLWNRMFALEVWCKWLLAIIVLVTPWWFGSVSALPQFLITGVLVVSMSIWVVKCFIQRETYRPHMISLLVLMFLIAGLVQQVNLPELASSRVATKQIEIRESLANQLDKQHKELATSLRLQTQVALNPTAANYQFSYFCLLSAAFFLGSRFFFRRREILILASVLAINGGLIAVFGAFQKVADPNQIYGHTLQFGGVPFGPFVNRNNASGYLLMCLACGLSVLVYKFSTFHPRRAGRESGLSKEGFWYGVLRDLQAIFAGLNVARIGMLVVCGFIITGILMSLSRGGMIALCVSIVVYLLFLFRMKSRRGVVLLIMFLMPTSAVTLVVSGMNEKIGNRIDTLQDDDLMSSELRIKLWKDSLKSLRDYPVLGSGLGSFPYVYKEYQTFVDDKWCFHAENVYVEILVTMGIVGAVLMFTAVFVFSLFVRSLSQSSSDSRSASPKSIAIGGLMLFLIVSQMISNFFDFGLLIPSNGLMFAILLGALTGAWCTRIEQDKRNNPRRLSRLPRWTTVPIVLVMIFLCARSGIEFWQTHTTEVANLSARTDDVNKYTKADVEGLIARFESVLESRPNLQTHEYLARLYVLRMQHEFVNQQIEDLKKNDPDLVVDREAVWKASSLRMINFQLAESTPEVRQSQIQRLMSFDFFKINVRAATLQYQRALATCPLSVRSLVGLAELAYLNQVDVSPYLESIDRYNIRKPDHLLRIGNVAISHGMKKVATKYWKLAINLQEDLVDVVVQTGVYFLEYSEVLEELLPRKPELLDRVAENYYAVPAQRDGLSAQQLDAIRQREEIREKYYAKIVEILTRDVYADAQSNYLLGKAFVETGDQIRAIESYKTATMLDPLNVKWKSELATLYIQVGRREDAKAELEKCKSLDPTNEVNYMKRISAL